MCKYTFLAIFGKVFCMFSFCVIASLSFLLLLVFGSYCTLSMFFFFFGIRLLFVLPDICCWYNSLKMC